MNRHLTLTTGIVLSARSLLYLGGSAYRAPFEVDTLGDLHATTSGQADAPESTVVFTDYRCPHCGAFEGTMMPNLEKLEEVEQNTTRAREIGIRGTPTVLPKGLAYANPDRNTLQGANVKDASATLSLDLTDPHGLELFPLIFADNHVGTEVAPALRGGDTANVISLRAPLIRAAPGAGAARCPRSLHQA